MSERNVGGTGNTKSRKYNVRIGGACTEKSKGSNTSYVLISVAKLSRSRFGITMKAPKIGTAAGDVVRMMLPELELLRIYLDAAQLVAIWVLISGLLDERPSLCIALKCLTDEGGVWEQEYGELKQSYGDRVTQWDMVPHVL